PELTIASVRPYRRGYLVRFEGVETRTQAEALHGRYVLQSVDALPGRGEDELFYHELLGMRVETSGGEEVGEIVEVYELRPADMLEVRRPQGGTALIPFLDAYVVEIDVGARRMVLDPPEGLLDL
ncbi:MAG: 16S rRNA processing protein RimM, partial [Gemmatimonadetes bacterium]